LFVTSKLWNTFHASEHVRPACEKTLADLGLDYLDLYLIHFPISLEYVDPTTRYPPEWFVDPAVKKECTLANVPIRETWEAMEELVPAGLAKNIGVANFTSVMLMDLLKYAKVHPSVNQVEIHPYLQQTQLLEYCAHHKIAVTAYSSFGGQSYVELNAESALKTPSLLKHEKVVAIAQKLKVSTAQVLLRWAIQKKLAVIPKTSDEKRLIENADLFAFKLSDDDMTTIATLNKPLRFNDPKVWFGTPLTIFG
jgi:diketogulonate reductase-like aldo/keto reductase